MGDATQSHLDAQDKQVEIWKVKKLVKSLTLARGNGTSMISLVIPPRDQISRVAKMLADEYGTASNIKSRVNRLSVLGAITSEMRSIFFSHTFCNRHTTTVKTLLARPTPWACCLLWDYND
mmetsp:Transcript_20319/g.67109  ORF Transcript_20319/g.67109 Transcript_20319/m.67109 type:complete len:121 (-) Transcript_20319:1319-1681(-)